MRSVAWFLAAMVIGWGLGIGGMTLRAELTRPGAKGATWRVEVVRPEGDDAEWVRRIDAEVVGMRAGVPLLADPTNGNDQDLQGKLRSDGTAAADLAKKLEKMVGITTIPGTAVIEVSVDAGDPTLSVAIAEALINARVRYWVAREQEELGKPIASLEEARNERMARSQVLGNKMHAGTSTKEEVDRHYAMKDEMFDLDDRFRRLRAIAETNPGQHAIRYARPSPPKKP